MKKLLVLAFAGLCCATTQAAYLYWQVSDSSAQAFTSAKYAVLKQSDASGNSNFRDVQTVEFSAGSTPMMSMEWAEVADLNTSNFYIELYNYDSSKNEWESVGVTQYASYTSLAASGALTSSLVSVPTAWTGGTMMVPEPTSGLLMLLGVAALGLKRRKA